MTDRPSTSKSRGVCRYFISERGCLNGESCRFLHGEAERLTPYDKSKTCKFYNAGFCRRGDVCWFRHIDVGPVASSSMEGASAALIEPEACGICLEKPVTYGLLAGCSHVFCLKCLRNWRDTKNKTEDVIASGNIKKCPYCRSLSSFITPSSHFYPGGPRKTEIIEQYKASMARVPCRYFQQSLLSPHKFCPYGRDCFYQHRLADGTPYVFPHGTDYYMARQRRYARLWERSSSPSSLINHFHDLILTAAAVSPDPQSASRNFRDRGAGTLSTLITDILHYGQAHGELDMELWRMRENVADDQASDSDTQHDMHFTGDRTAASSPADMPPLETIPISPESMSAMQHFARLANFLPHELDGIATSDDIAEEDTSDDAATALVQISRPLSEASRSSSRFRTVLPRAERSPLVFTVDSDEEDSGDEQEILRSTSASPLIRTFSTRRTPNAWGLRASNTMRNMSFGQVPVTPLTVLPSSAGIRSFEQRSHSSPPAPTTPQTPAVVFSPDSEVHVAVDSVLQETEGTLRDLNKIERSLADTLGTGTDAESREAIVRGTMESLDEVRVPVPKEGPRRSRSSLAMSGAGNGNGRHDLSPSGQRLVRTASDVQHLSSGAAAGGFVTDGRGRVIRTSE